MDRDEICTIRIGEVEIWTLLRQEPEIRYVMKFKIKKQLASSNLGNKE